MKLPPMRSVDLCSDTVNGPANTDAASPLQRWVLAKKSECCAVKFDSVTLWPVKQLVICVPLSTVAPDSIMLFSMMALWPIVAWAPIMELFISDAPESVAPWFMAGRTGLCSALSGRVFISVRASSLSMARAAICAVSPGWIRSAFEPVSSSTFTSMPPGFQPSAVIVPHRVRVAPLPMV